MKTINEIKQRRNVLAIAVWENEGGAPGRVPLIRQYGRRVEEDRTWTVYHVFTGIPAHANGRAMTGLSRSGATNGMLALNRLNEDRHSDRGN